MNDETKQIPFSILFTFLWISYFIQAFCIILTAFDSIALNDAFPRFLWIIIFSILLAYNLVWMMLYHFGNGNIPKKLSLSYRFYMWTIQSQTFLFSVLMYALTFTNLSTLPIQTSNERFKEYLILYALLAIPSGVIWVFTVTQSIRYRKQLLRHPK